MSHLFCTFCGNGLNPPPPPPPHPHQVVSYHTINCPLTYCHCRSQEVWWSLTSFSVTHYQEMQGHDWECCLFIISLVKNKMHKSERFTTFVYPSDKSCLHDVFSPRHTTITASPGDNGTYRISVHTINCTLTYCHWHSQEVWWSLRSQLLCDTLPRNARTWSSRENLPLGYRD